MVKFSFQMVKSTATPSLVCSYENAKYVFNVPDGFQRHYREHKVKFQPGTIFFFSRLSTATLSGMFGFIQTLVAENSALGCKFYGPRGLTTLMNVLRYNDIGGYKTLPYSFQEFDGSLLLGAKDMKFFEDMMLSKQNDCLLQAELEKLKELQFDPKDSNNAGLLLQNPLTFKDENLEIQAVYTQNNLQYIIHSKQIPGGISKQKLTELQIPQSKMKDLMKNGSLTLEGGQVVTIKDVQEESTPPQSVVVLDIQNKLQLEAFLQSQQFQTLVQQDAQKAQNISSFIHLSQNVEFEEYQHFIAKFNRYSHILCNYEQPNANKIMLANMGFQPTSKIYNNLMAARYPEHFRVIPHSPLPKIPQQLVEQQNIFGYVPMFEFRVLPAKSRGYAPVAASHNEQQVQIRQMQQHQLKDFRLTFLGTCSMKPGKYRNVTGNILSVVNKGNIILDCGEGSYKQLVDCGIEICNKPLLIWISHSHSDHHMGILTILDEYRRLSNKFSEVFVIVPAVMVPWLSYYEIIIREGFKMKLVTTQQFEEAEIDLGLLIENQFSVQRVRYGPKVDYQFEIHLAENYVELRAHMKDFFGIKDLQVARVEHCPQAYGVKLTLADGRVITYSGDTRPCEAFCKLTENADIMIHEATYTEDLQENALTNMHSTIPEAIEIGKKSKSKVIALTHFSQRYSKKLELKQEHLELENLVFAYDLMSADLGEMAQLSKISKEILLQLDE